VTPSISFEKVDLDKDAVGGPISTRVATDLEPEVDRSRRGSGPISAGVRPGLQGVALERSVQSTLGQ